MLWKEKIKQTIRLAPNLSTWDWKNIANSGYYLLLIYKIMIADKSTAEKICDNIEVNMIYYASAFQEKKLLAHLNAVI